MRYAKSIALALALGLAAATPAYAQSAGNSSQGTLSSPARPPASTMALGQFVGADVVTPDGETVGTLARILEGQNGMVAAVIQTGQDEDGQDVGLVVPVEKLHVEQDKVVLDASEDEMESAPSINPANPSDNGSGPSEEAPSGGSPGQSNI